MEKHFQIQRPFLFCLGICLKLFSCSFNGTEAHKVPKAAERSFAVKRQKGARMHIRTAASRQPTDTCDEAVAHAVSQHPTYWRDSPHASKKREIKKGPAVQYYRCWVKNCRLQTASKDDKFKISTTQQYKDFQDIG